jgi:dTMP kinase
MKGYFITFEGMEGCGKSTQTILLANYFYERKREVLLTREPGGPKISEAIRDILLNNDNAEMLPETELLLYMASRCQHTGEWILPALAENKIVICDRYNDSTLAYQGVARDLDRKFIDNISSFATFNLMPEITFLIDIPVEIGLGRIDRQKADRMESETLEFHKKVRNAYLELAKMAKARYFVLDGTMSINDIHSEIIEKLKKEGIE